ncbi:MAG TPA: FAD-dependent monooxygenase [Ramlibacter sp.]|uniref:FAD-dependent monooxygenase n=1 Tax=Ramlibacter sp. TaxID=1917967 RepID=UPI002C037001|nr:FAD-dependent monooxygenase [Ramlibacter sp.]HVZ42610.1 FAD-dependent monooxygenase [Ramlibacter sp.]
MANEDVKDVAVVGGGPAGMMAGLLFARAGLKVAVLEKHRDFLRDFRGDTVHPSTLEVFHELGLLRQLLERPHNKVEQLGGRIGGQYERIADFRRLPVAAPYIALMPQWDFLDFVAGAARRYAGFELRQSCAGESLLEEGGRVAGVRTSEGDAVRARLVIACDGRDSRFRGGLPQRVIGAPMDVFWFRLPKRARPENDSMGVFDRGRIFVLIDRGDYWQCAFVFAKGGAERLRAEGLEAFKERVREVGPETAGVDDAIRGWDDVKLLTVTVDRLEQWWRPGLLVIGDAAHATRAVDAGGAKARAGRDRRAAAGRPGRAREASACRAPPRCVCDAARHPGAARGARVPAGAREVARRAGAFARLAAGRLSDSRSHATPTVRCLRACHHWRRKEEARTHACPQRVPCADGP